MLQFAGEDVAIKWSRRRRTVGLVVTAEGRLVVYAPVGTPQRKIEQAIASHRAWIEEKAAQRKAAWDRLQDGQAFYLGRAYHLMAVPEAEAPVTMTAREIRVRVNGRVRGLWPQLRSWYLEQAAAVFRERLHHFADLMALRVGKAQLADWKRRWGECHPEGCLKFNWRLIMLPPEMLDYVVVHELAHLKVPGHPREFWCQVGNILPDYARRRQWLNHYGTPFLLWQPGEPPKGLPRQKRKN